MRSKIKVKRLGFEFNLPTRPPPIFTPREFALRLINLQGRTICIDYERGIDGPQTAARLIRETYEEAGVVFTHSEEDAEALVWIQAGSTDMRFAFLVVNPRDGGQYVCGECGPRELTAAIMTAVCIFFESQQT